MIAERGTVDHETQSGTLDRRAKDAGQFGRQRRQVWGLEDGLHSPGFDARDIEQCIDQLEEPQSVAVRHLETFAMDRGERFVGIRQGVLNRTQQQ